MDYLVMLASAFGLGAAHALEPGHGKTVVAAYLIGSRGRTLDAIILGAVVTFTHTFSVMILAIASTVAAAYIVPQQVERWLAIGSGLLVTAVGAWMLYVRARHGPPLHSHRHSSRAHELQARDDEHDPQPPHPRPQYHDRGHPHLHPHPQVEDDYPAESPARAGAGDVMLSDRDEKQPDTPRAAGGDATGVGFGSLVALGVSGGIVPCPAALLLIPAAIGLGAVVKGLGLIVSFSLGLALVLMAIGILTLKAAGFASGWLERGDWAQRVAVASACFITLLGLVLTLKALLAPAAH